MEALLCAFQLRNTMVGSSDVKLGEIDGTPFYMNEEQYENGNILT